MSTQSDIFDKLKKGLPTGWFGFFSPLIDCICSGTAQALAIVYDNIEEAKPVFRIKTAYSGFLDLIALDFFGDDFPRHDNELDVMYRGRILGNLFRERATRRAMKEILTEATGYEPRIFEPQNPLDVAHTGLMYLNVAARLASTHYPYQAFVSITKPDYVTAFVFPGLNTVGMTLNQGAYLAGKENLYYNINLMLCRLVELTKPYGTLIWVNIDGQPLSNLSYLDIDAITDKSIMA